MKRRACISLNMWRQACRRLASRRKVVYIFVALVIIAIDIFLPIYKQVQIPGAATIPITFLIVGTLVWCGWNPVLAGVLFATFTGLSILAPREYISLGLIASGIHLVGADWISRTYTRSGIALMLCIDSMAVLNAPRRYVDASLVASIVAFLIAIVLGLLIRHVTVYIVELESALKSAREAEDLSRRRISTVLHDTVASELTKVIIAADGLRSENISADINQRAAGIAANSRAGLSDLRAIISNMNIGNIGNEGPFCIDERINECRTVLSQRGIDLVEEIPKRLRLNLNGGFAHILDRTIREGCLNILKYGEEDSHAFLTIEYDEQLDLNMMLTNVRTKVSHVSGGGTSGGYGLSSLSLSAKEQNCALTYGPSGPLWIVHLHIPISSTVHN